MAVVVTAVAQSGYRVVITVTGMVSPYVWTMERVEAGAAKPVRGPGWIGNSVLTDHEAPLNLPVFYQVTWYELVGPNLVKHVDISAAPVTVVGARPVLGNPVTGEYVETNIQSWPEWQRGERASTLEVPGADYPIIVSDRLGAATGQVTLRTDTPASRIAMRELLLVGRVYLLRPACSGVDDESGYLHMRQVTSRRRSNHAGDPVRFWPLDVTHCGMPTPLIPASGATLQDLHNAYPIPLTLNDLNIAVPGTLVQIAELDL